MLSILKKAPWLLVAATLACTTYTGGNFPLQPAQQRRAATSADSVQLVQGPVDRTYVVVGKVHAHGRCNWFFGFTGCGDEQMQKLLREEAARLGATAIIDIRSGSFSRFEWSDVHLHGTAIAY